MSEDEVTVIDSNGGFSAREAREKVGKSPAFVSAADVYNDLRGTKKEPREDIPTLSDVGIDKKLSARAQKIPSSRPLIPLKALYKSFG